MKMRLILLVLLVASGCSDGGGDAPGSPTPARVRPRSTATIKIAAPESGASLPSGTVHVRVDLQGGTIVPEATTDLKPDEGHIHIKIDGATVSMAYGVDQDIGDVKP